MKVVAIISFILMAVYLLYCAIRYGVKGYVSDNYYIAKEKWLFSAMMMSTAVVLCPLMIAKGGNTWGFLGALAGFGLLLVGVEPHYKDFGSLAHNVGAWMACISSVIWSAIFHPYITACVFFAYLAYYIAVGKKVMYVAEISVFALVYFNLLF